MYNRDKARFDAADIDGDEKLTEAEFVLFKNPLKDEAVKTAVIAECLNVVDTDKDGKINLQEYLNDWHVPVSWPKLSESWNLFKNLAKPKRRRLHWIRNWQV